MPPSHLASPVRSPRCRSTTTTRSEQGRSLQSSTRAIIRRLWSPLRLHLRGTRPNSPRYPPPLPVSVRLSKMSHLLVHRRGLSLLSRKPTHPVTTPPP